MLSFNAPTIFSEKHHNIIFVSLIIIQCILMYRVVQEKIFPQKETENTSLPHPRASWF